MIAWSLERRGRDGAIPIYPASSCRPCLRVLMEFAESPLTPKQACALAVHPVTPSSIRFPSQLADEDSSGVQATPASLTRGSFQMWFHALAAHQAVRTILLAKATAATLVGRLWRRRSHQIPFSFDWNCIRARALVNIAADANASELHLARCTGLARYQAEEGGQLSS